jgi:hypothetical protein
MKAFSQFLLREIRALFRAAINKRNSPVDGGAGGGEYNSLPLFLREFTENVRPLRIPRRSLHRARIHSRPRRMAVPHELQSSPHPKTSPRFA